jgi:hypothetical protein
MKFSANMFIFYRVNARRDRDYNFLGNPGKPGFDYNASGNSFPISPIRLTGGARDWVLRGLASPLLSPPERMKAPTPAPEPDKRNLDHDFAQGQLNASSGSQGISGPFWRDDYPTMRPFACMMERHPQAVTPNDED